MNLVIHKYGGTSVANLPHLQQVADIIRRDLDSGRQVVAVVSAMRGIEMEGFGASTDGLLDVARAAAGVDSIAALYDGAAQGREADALAALGEMMTAPLLALTLQAKGVDAVSFNTFQAGLRVAGEYGRARIDGVDADAIRQALQQGKVPVLTGFQGLDEENNAFATLGRGCSDTSAIALAAELQADECMLYKDVAGVYPVDPRLFADAEPLRHVTFGEMAELAYDGAPILHVRAVELAWKYKIPLRVLSTFEPNLPGTRITQTL